MGKRDWYSGDIKGSQDLDLGYGYKINLNFSDDPQGAKWFQLNIQMLYLKILREKISKHFACCHRYLKTRKKKK